MSDIKRFFSYPGMKLFKIYKILYSLSLYPIYKVLFRNFGIFTYISPSASLVNKLSMSIGRNVIVNRCCTIWTTDLYLGDFVQINPGSVIYGKIKIGKNVLIGPNCNIVGGNHRFEDLSKPIRTQGSNSVGIEIGDDVWLGAAVSIVDGVKIGSGSIIGAGSVLTKNIPRNSIVVGNPGKVIRTRGRS